MVSHCSYCNKYFTNLDEHLDSKEHKKNVLADCVKNNIELYDKYTIEDFKKHFDVMRFPIVIKGIQEDKDDPFWVFAKDCLNKNDLIELRRYVNGEGKRTKLKYTRNNGRSRFGRTTKSGTRSGKGLHKRKKNTRI